MKIPLYSFYTKSHKIFYSDFFLPSFNKCNLEQNFELRVFESNHIDSTFRSKGFNNTMKNKAKMIREALNENEVILYADCDIQFFRNPFEDLMNYFSYEVDCLAQRDRNTICAGFMLLKSNKKTKDLFDKVVDGSYEKIGDQKHINDNRHMINYVLLPSDKYFNLGKERKDNFDSIEDVKLSKDMIMHHGNFVKGIDRKIKLMNLVREKYKSLWNSEP